MSFFRKACMYTMNLYNFQENLFLFSRNFTVWIGLQLASQSDSFQALGSCFCEKYSKCGVEGNEVTDSPLEDQVRAVDVKQIATEINSDSARCDPNVYEVLDKLKETLDDYDKGSATDSLHAKNLTAVETDQPIDAKHLDDAMSDNTTDSGIFDWFVDDDKGATEEGNKIPQTVAPLDNTESDMKERLENGAESKETTPGDDTVSGDVVNECSTSRSSSDIGNETCEVEFEDDIPELEDEVPESEDEMDLYIPIILNFGHINAIPLISAMEQIHLRDYDYVPFSLENTPNCVKQSSSITQLAKLYQQIESLTNVQVSKCGNVLHYRQYNPAYYSQRFPQHRLYGPPMFVACTSGECILTMRKKSYKNVKTRLYCGSLICIPDDYRNLSSYVHWVSPVSEQRILVLLYGAWD